MNDSRRWHKPALWLILSLIAASCMEFYVAKVWSAGQPPYFSDLYAPWWGAHEFLLHGRNPYTPAVAREIQTAIYGAPLGTADRGGPAELAGGFAYPLHAAFLLGPTVRLSFSSAQILFLCLSIAITLGSPLLWLRAFHLPVPPLRVLTFALLTLGSFPALQGIRLQNLSLIAAGLLAAALVLLATGHLTLAGVLFAASTFKPQFTLLVVPWLACWTVRDWRRRQSLAWSFGGSMLVLIGVGEWLLPGWIGSFLRVVRAYRQYTFGRSLLDVWFTPRIGPFVATGLLVIVFALCWQHRCQPANSPGFFVATSLMLAATLVTIPTLAPHTQLLLLPGFLCLYRYCGALWKSKGLARLLLVAVWLLLAWPWAAAAALTLTAAFVPVRGLLPWWELPLYTSPLLPLTVLSTLVCVIRLQPWQAEPDLHLR